MLKFFVNILKAGNYGKVVYLELSFHQISKTVIRLIVRTNIAPRSQRLVLINQRGRHILSSKDAYNMCFHVFSFCVLFVDADRRYPGVDLHSHTHSLSLSVSPLPCLSLFQLKRCCDTGLMINRNTDFSQLSSYHFKGSTYTKLVSPVGMKKSLLRL